MTLGPVDLKALLALTWRDARGLARMLVHMGLSVQARMLAAYVRGDVPGYTGFTVR